MPAEFAAILPLLLMLPEMKFTTLSTSTPVRAVMVPLLLTPPAKVEIATDEPMPAALPPTKMPTRNS